MKHQWNGMEWPIGMSDSKPRSLKHEEIILPPSFPLSFFIPFSLPFPPAVSSPAERRSLVWFAHLRGGNTFSLAENIEIINSLETSAGC